MADNETPPEYLALLNEQSSPGVFPNSGGGCKTCDKSVHNAQGQRAFARYFLQPRCPIPCNRFPIFSVDATGSVHVLPVAQIRMPQACQMADSLNLHSPTYTCPPARGRSDCDWYPSRARSQHLRYISGH